MFFAMPTSPATEYRVILEEPEGNLIARSRESYRIRTDELDMREHTSNIVLYGPAESELRAFIRANGLAPWIETACSLVEKHFQTDGQLILKKHSDPEFPDEWVTLEVIAKGEVEQILNGYDAFTRDMVCTIPGELGSKIRLCLGVA